MHFYLLILLFFVCFLFIVLYFIRSCEKYSKNAEMYVNFIPWHAYFIQCYEVEIKKVVRQNDSFSKICALNLNIKNLKNLFCFTSTITGINRINLILVKRNNNKNNEIMGFHQ